MNEIEAGDILRIKRSYGTNGQHEHFWGRVGQLVRVTHVETSRFQTLLLVPEPGQHGNDGYNDGQGWSNDMGELNSRFEKL